MLNVFLYKNVITSVYFCLFQCLGLESKACKANEDEIELNTKERYAKIWMLTEKEHWLGLGIMIAAAEFNCRGYKL